MCGCEAHWTDSAQCTCLCPEHESLRTGSSVSNDWLPDLQTSLEEGDIAVAAVVVCQAIKPDGKTTYYVKFSPGLDDMTAVGMLDSALTTQRKAIQERWEGD